MFYYWVIVIFHFFLFHEKFLYLREQFIYNKYYRFAPFYFVFLILYLLIKLHIIKKEPLFYEKNSIQKDSLFYGSILIFFSYFGIIICLEAEFNYPFFLFFIVLLIGYSVLVIKRKYWKLFIKFYSLFVVVIPLPFISDVLFEEYIDNEAVLLLEKYFKIIKIIILIMMILIFFLFFILVIRRKIYEIKDRKKKEIKEEYTEIINYFLYEKITLNDAVNNLGRINYPFFLMSIETMLDLVKGEFEDKIIELCQRTGVYDFLKKESHSRHWWKRVKSVYHLGKLKYTDGFDNGTFVRLFKDKSDDVRAATVVAFTLINDFRALKYIIEALFDKSRIVNEKAKEGLIKYGKKSFNILIQKLENEKNTENIIKILNLISYIRDDNFVNLINDYLNHSNKRIVAAAIDIAASLEYPVDKDLLLKYLNTNDVELIKTVLRNIHYISDDTLVDIIKSFICHTDWDIRYFTTVGLYKLGSKGIATLKDIIQNSNDKYAVDMAKMVIDEFTIK